MPGRTEARTISYKEVDSVSESSELSSEDEEDQEFEARLEASGAPLVRRKRTKKKSKSSDKSRKRRRQKGSPSRASNSTENDDAEEDDAPCSGDDGSGEGAAEGASGEAETLQAANPFEKLPFELFCEIFSYLDLGDLIQLTRTSHYLNGMLLAPSAQSIWSRSRRNAGYVLFPGMSEIRPAKSTKSPDMP
ncbi:hypothetical protein B0A53_04687 [Rhodotorula sp. CCFEE 5036]|nr:hypothetical protein B0A53_04687 [Rhodotorula sp. CCFEE 5036]